MCDRGLDEIELARALNTPSSPPIFRLDDNCCGKIFDFLTLNELIAIGQTCKRMHSIAGHFFQQNYPREDVYSICEGICTENTNMIDFTRFIQTIRISDEVLDHIELYPFDSLRQLFLSEITLSKEEISCMKKVLRNIEGLELERIYLHGDIYRKLLTFCENLKELTIKYSYAEDSYGNQKKWLLRKYPKLEYLSLTGRRNILIPKSYLKRFLENNSSVQTLSIDDNFLWENRNALFEANFQLDTLHIDGRGGDIKYDSICEILNKLREKGKIKKIYFTMVSLSISRSRQLKVEADLLPIIDILGVEVIGNSIGWQQLIKLKELHTQFMLDTYLTDWDILARSLVNIEKITVHYARDKNILPFIRHSSCLTEIRAMAISRGHELGINILEWNNERKKLAGAQKVMIYVGESTYLATKWSKGGTEQSLIQVKRDTSMNFRDKFMQF